MGKEESLWLGRGLPLWLRALVWLHTATGLVPVCGVRQDESFFTRAAGTLQHQPNGPGVLQGREFGFFSLSSSVLLSFSCILLQPVFVSNNKNTTEWHLFWYIWSFYKALCIITLGRTMHNRTELCISFAAVFICLNFEITLVIKLPFLNLKEHSLCLL